MMDSHDERKELGKIYCVLFDDVVMPDHFTAFLFNFVTALVARTR